MANEAGKDRKRAVNPVLDALQQKLRLEMNAIADNMLAGSCQDYAQYREMVGDINGLARAERELLDLDIQMDVED